MVAKVLGSYGGKLGVALSILPEGRGRGPSVSGSLGDLGPVTRAVQPEMRSGVACGPGGSVRGPRAGGRAPGAAGIHPRPRARGRGPREGSSRRPRWPLGSGPWGPGQSASAKHTPGRS